MARHPTTTNQSRQKHIAALQRQEHRDALLISSLKSSLVHHRYHGVMQRRHLVERLAAAERAYRAIYDELLKLNPPSPYSLYQPQVPVRTNGINVTVELSLDGFAFSNPAPSVPNGAAVWVRAKIEENHTGSLGIPKTHELIHVAWAYAPVYVPTDGIGSAGRDEYMVSNPLILTREFKAPGSGSTKYNFFVYVDAYDRQQ